MNLRQADTTNVLQSASAAAQPEHRRTRRQRALKEAKVVLSDWTTIDCTIRDMTKEGARLLFPGIVSLPQDFRVIVVAAETIAPARLLWQRGLSAGVAFAGPAQPTASHKP